MLASTSACIWLIDANGSLVYLSPEMLAWLGVDENVPETIAAAITPDPIMWTGTKPDRGHLTRRLHIPAIDPINGQSSGHPAHQPATRVVTAHFVKLAPLAKDSDESESPGVPLVLGCLGEFVADADVPWTRWFGEQGVRESAKLDEQISKFRAQQKRQATMLIAGTSSTSRQFRARVELACRIRCHLSLNGPLGCGAAELASMIHHASAPGEALVCLDASLMDSELLEAYASPVIAEIRENSDVTGTLCLDRLDEMPTDGQARLSEWLETWPRRLRLIGIRHDEATSSNSMIEPLTDLMTVFPITIPSLSARRDDLELIASGLVRSARLSRETLDLLRSYPWPGQWEELTSAIRFANDMAPGDRIGREHLPLAIRSYRTSQHASAHVVQNGNEITIGPRPPSPRDFKLESLDATLREYEDSLIAQAMEAADGNKAEAARRLGISRARLLRKLSGDS
ncbi:helix-turn-helix domain-containing protein [Rhodopirellula sp. SWK7]|uniref:helix-turn-helix domain-containing protein n=1 Tax=Rhodopirellula sp. SWK7 TaxID=595460 RepID=UPI0002BE1246|nr:helix-turn-helix domain-containing protein [Rhodopirellula sp. SWK7]EMI43880.1 sigma-54 dependent transcriptional regulator/response regulator [Rhodopirellula sp. SWK7]